MLKKILLATAMLFSATFASWDFFPITETGRGSAKAGLYYDWDHKWSQAGLSAGVRFTMLPNLEISIQDWGFQFWGETDCKGCENGGSGIRDLKIGGRYQVIPHVNLFLDINLPIGTTDDDGGTTPPGSDEFFLFFGGQYTMDIPSAKGLSFGTEAAFLWSFERHDYERGLELHFGAEMDYTVPNTKVTPFLGLKFNIRMTESTYESDEDKTYGFDDNGSNEFMLWLGAKYAVSPKLNISGNFIFRNQDLEKGSPFGMGGDAAGFYFGCEFFF